MGRELIVKLTLFWQPLRRPLPCDEEPLCWLLQKESSQQAHRTLQKMICQGAELTQLPPRNSGEQKVMFKLKLQAAIDPIHPGMTVKIHGR